MTGYKTLAHKKYLEIGAPNPKMEQYRYCRLRDLSFEKAKGEFEACGVENGVLALPLEEATATFGAFLHGRFEKWLAQENDPFACLNGALSDDGLLLYVPPKTEAKITLKHSGKGGMLLPRIFVYVGKGASLSLDLEQEAENTVNRFLDFTVEENASVKLHFGDGAEKQIDTVRASLKRDSRFKSVNTRKSQPFQRQDYTVALLGENSSCELFGVCELTEETQSHTNVLIKHLAEHTHSSQKFKGVIDNKARASFEGKIFVEPQAQKTEAYQKSSYLVLSPDAAAYSKPNLEIFADDVKASHGATIGQLDPENLFYLQSRGLSKEEAKKLLVEGFVQEIYNEIS